MKKLYHYIRLSLAIRFPSLREKFLTEEEQTKLSILEIRSMAKFFGHNMSDQDILNGCEEMGRIMSKAKLTCEEASKVFANINTQK